jgi:hypothetical protein
MREEMQRKREKEGGCEGSTGEATVDLEGEKPQFAKEGERRRRRGEKESWR